MARPEHLVILKKGCKAWNDWRLTNAEDIDLSAADLSGDFLNGADLGMGNLQKANFSGTFLSMAFLSGANLREANLRGAFLSMAILIEADCRKADFTGANLNRADLSRAILNGANLSQTTGLTQEQINVAVGDAETRIPDGLSRPNSWLLQPK